MGAPLLQPRPLYRPRNPQASGLWRVASGHFDEFERVYDERFAAKYGFWRPVIRHAVQAYLKCGDLREGFARVRCPNCTHEMFVAFSCKQRCACPSCSTLPVQPLATRQGDQTGDGPLQGREARLPRIPAVGRRWTEGRRQAQLSGPEPPRLLGRVHPAHPCQGRPPGPLLRLVFQQVARGAPEGRAGRRSSGTRSPGRPWRTGRFRGRRGGPARRRGPATSPGPASSSASTRWTRWSVPNAAPR